MGRPLEQSATASLQGLERGADALPGQSALPRQARPTTVAAGNAGGTVRWRHATRGGRWGGGGLNAPAEAQASAGGARG